MHPHSPTLTPSCPGVPAAQPSAPPQPRRVPVTVLEPGGEISVALKEEERSKDSAPALPAFAAVVSTGAGRGAAGSAAGRLAAFDGFVMSGGGGSSGSGDGMA